MNIEDLFDGAEEVKIGAPPEVFLRDGLYCVFTQHRGLLSVWIHNMQCWTPKMEQACEVVQFAAEYFKDEKTLGNTFPHLYNETLTRAICTKLGLDSKYAWVGLVRELTDEEAKEVYGSDEEEE